MAKIILSDEEFNSLPDTPPAKMILSDEEMNSLPDVPQNQPSKIVLSDDEFNALPDVQEQAQPSILDMPPVQEPQPLMTAGDFTKSAAADLPVAGSQLLSGITGFTTDALKGTGKAATASAQMLLQALSPTFNSAQANNNAEAMRQGIDVDAETLKGMFENAAANTQQYYTGQRPEETYSNIPVKTELLPDDYAQRMAKVKDAPIEQPGMFDNIPGGREIIASLKAIPEFAGASAEELGRIAGALSAGDIETSRQVLSKPFTTVGIPAVGVVTGPRMAVSAKRALVGGAPEVKTESRMNPEDQKYLDEYNQELQSAEAKIIENPQASEPAPQNMQAAAEALTGTQKIETPAEIVRRMKKEGAKTEDIIAAVKERKVNAPEAQQGAEVASPSINAQPIRPKRGLSSNLGIEAQNAYEAGAKKVKELWEMTKAEFDKENVLYHGGPEISDNVLRRGAGGKRSDMGGLFFTDNKDYAKNYAKPAIYEVAKKDFADNIFDPRKPEHVEKLKDGFLKMVDEGEYETAADALKDYNKIKNLDLLDWSVGGQHIDIIKAAGFDGTIYRERPGNISKNADGSFNVKGEPIYSVASFKKEVPASRNLHKDIVKKALDEGQPVPPEVLAEYPDLQLISPEPTTTSGAPPSSLFKGGTSQRGAATIGPIVDRIASSYKELRDKLMEKRSKASEISGSAVDNVIEFLWEKYQPALKEIENKSGKTEATKVFEDIERQRYADNVIKSYLKDSGLIEEIFQTLKKNNISPDQYGVYNEARRVLFEPNPTGKPFRLSRQEAFDAMNEFNPAQRAALMRIHTKENQIRQSTLIPEWEKSEVFNDQIINFMKANDNYSRNVVAEYALKNVPKTDKMSGELLKRIGSTKDIFNPWEQKIVGDRATTQFASRQVAVRSIAEALERTGAAKNKPFDGSEPIEYMHKGQWKTKYVPKDMAYAINHFPEEMSNGAKFLDWLVYQNPASKFMEQQLIKNPGFILGNSMLLDPITTWWQLPDKKSIVLYPLVHLLTVADKMGSKTGRSLAKKWGLKDAVELNKEMTEQRIYNIGSLADRATEVGETQLASMLENLGLNSELLEFFGAPRSMWSKLADKTGLAKKWRQFENVAAAADNTSKESLYNYLKRFRPDLSQTKINQMVREMGTPATKRSGTGAPIIGRTVQFGNAALQGGRATLKNFKDSPSTFLLKNVGMPVALAYGVYQWAQSDPKAKKVFDQLSDYQKNNFLNIYIGEEDGKPAVISLPLPRFARNIYALTMNLLEGDKTFGENAQTLIEGIGNMGFSEIPTTLKQPLRFAGDVAKYATGEPIYDSYRKQPIIPKRVQEADATFYNKIFGDSKLNDLDTSKAFGKYLLNNYIMGGWFRYDPKKEVPEGMFGLASQLPAVSRVIRMASGGVEKKLGDVIKEENKMKSRAIIQLEKTAEQAIKENKPLKLSDEDLQALEISPKTLEYALLKQIMKKMKKEDTTNFMKLLNAMQGQDQKTQLKLMREFEKRGY